MEEKRSEVKLICRTAPRSLYILPAAKHIAVTCFHTYIAVSCNNNMIYNFDTQKVAGFANTLRQADIRCRGFPHTRRVIVYQYNTVGFVQESQTENFGSIHNRCRHTP